ncbi:hypothetical protein P3T76_014401 [Phytophthora citrophthora]|uniref:Crinkler effector protein N-terminal domain-containing protein n=1 Tax=Phytophthora citrophthora TaxID=4793 RepID=A0AAD9G1I4_9STRA|nr:hypothetical protein P3T76_014401 [Phytophthora citrophthora]
MTLLSCAIIGDGSVISVPIQMWMTVAFLKEEIKKNKADTITCDVKNLQLFLAKKGGAWLDEAEAKTVTLNHAEKQFVEMNPMLWLKNKNHFGANFEPDESHVHLLVVVPETTWAAPRDVSGEMSVKRGREVTDEGESPKKKKRKVDGEELTFWMEQLNAISELGEGLDREVDLTVETLLETSQEVFGVLGVDLRKGLYV